MRAHKEPKSKKPKAAPPPELTAIMERIGALPTVDEVFERNAKSKAPEDRRVMVEFWRAQRPLWNFKETKAKDKRDGYGDNQAPTE